MFSSLVEQSFFISLSHVTHRYTSNRGDQKRQFVALSTSFLLSGHHFIIPGPGESEWVSRRAPSLSLSLSLSLPARDVLNVLLFLGHKQWPGSHGDFSSCWSNMRPGSWECLSNYTTILPFQTNGEVVMRCVSDRLVGWRRALHSSYKYCSFYCQNNWHSIQKRGHKTHLELPRDLHS